MIVQPRRIISDDDIGISTKFIWTIETDIYEYVLVFC